MFEPLKIEIVVSLIVSKKNIEIIPDSVINFARLIPLEAEFRGKKLANRNL